MSASAAACAATSTPGQTRGACRTRSTPPASPTATTRSSRPRPSCAQLQYREDERVGATQRTRTHLSDTFRDRYTTEVLDKVDLKPIVEELPEDGTATLMCVEQDPEACHRSLIAKRMAAQHNLKVVHLKP